MNPNLLPPGAVRTFWRQSAGVLLAASFLGHPVVGAGELAEFTTPLFSGAGKCAFCHDPWTPQDAGSGAPLAADWRATMMAHSFKDPLWRAVMAAEVNGNPQLKSFIENKCQTCHAPLARTEAAANGTNQLALADARHSPLAGEGVGCTLCHQIQTNDLGRAASFTGQYTIGTNRLIFGPYPEVLTMPMRRHVDYTPVWGAQVQDSALCASCHTLFTPIVDAAGKVAGEFPEQVPYLEWRNSDHARSGRHCQDCHMPRQDEPTKVSSRPPWLEPRAPFWKHQFVGGNAFMLGLLANNAKALDANADARQFKPMIDRARAQLRRAAQLTVSAERHDGQLTLRVVVENLSGHKFPTGHPYRRAWLHVRVTNAKGRTLFESGAVDKSGKLAGVRNGYAPHHDVITRGEEVQVYQSVMADGEGQITWSLLRGATYLKDNRIPPKGFQPAGPDAAVVAVRGVGDQDQDFNCQGNGQDVVTYQLSPGESGRLNVRVELLYQAVPPDAVAHFLNSREPAALAFAKLYARQSKLPELVQRADLQL